MLTRILAIVGGLSGAAGLSQYPEFAQQYTQRLAGQVQALEVVVTDFDATAERSGLSRDEALAEMTGTQFLADRGEDMARTITRYEGLQSDYALLTAASPFEKMLMPHRLADGETFRGTWGDYEPAVPLTPAGAASAAVGYVAGWSIIAMLIWVLTAPFRGRGVAPTRGDDTTV
ncbi:MAG: DUF2937 family protein [Rhodobacteraceae bacterium]|nr:DUF2937 family protein [Paracoccaceae bacterium]